ncbi:MAG: hypothetical protein LBJ61_03160 [Deltaproteobacteria bacterium]|nr:hypothetical protein [Deltaproteobacteria bacterium]
MTETGKGFIRIRPKRGVNADGLRYGEYCLPQRVNGTKINNEMWLLKVIDEENNVFYNRKDGCFRFDKANRTKIPVSDHRPATVVVRARPSQIHGQDQTAQLRTRPTIVFGKGFVRIRAKRGGKADGTHYGIYCRTQMEDVRKINNEVWLGKVIDKDNNVFYNGKDGYFRFDINNGKRFLSDQTMAPTNTQESPPVALDIYSPLPPSVELAANSPDSQPVDLGSDSPESTSV